MCARPLRRSVHVAPATTDVLVHGHDDGSRVSRITHTHTHTAAMCLVRGAQLSSRESRPTIDDELIDKNTIDMGIGRGGTWRRETKGNHVRCRRRGGRTSIAHPNGRRRRRRNGVSHGYWVSDGTRATQESAVNRPRRVRARVTNVVRRAFERVISPTSRARRSFPPLGRPQAEAGRAHGGRVAARRTGCIHALKNVAKHWLVNTPGAPVCACLGERTVRANVSGKLSEEMSAR